MSYQVLITSQAQKEAQANHDWWAKHRSADQAARWYDEFLKSALSLEQNPNRFALAAESDRFPYAIHQLNFGIGNRATHRMLYAIHSNRVVILRIRHLAQQDIDIES